ncbi:hypothetical protein ACO0LG_06900 [Undibacterium sp. Ji42W]|uniref:hypothetical protein n=1 Tax=Undibacterium sp. Ji42W TaxID=3413039 RepID=UPI003BEFA9CA
MAKDKYFVEVLAADPANIPDVVLLNGFVGHSALEGYTRLYLNAVLNEYYEIPSEAILHTAAPSASSNNPLETAYVWIKADAELIRKGKSVADTKLSFFNGPIQSAQAASAVSAASNAAQAAVAGGPTGVLNCTLAPAQCGNTAWPGCPATPNKSN